MSSKTGKSLYERTLRSLQIELVKLHRHVIAKNLKIQTDADVAPGGDDRVGVVGEVV